MASLAWLMVATFPVQAADDVEPPAELGQFEAVLINGGGRRAVNYQSHLLHLRELYGLLLASGISRAEITIFSSDGPDPVPDLAARDTSESDSWLLGGTRLERSLNPRTSYLNSTVEGAALKPATKAELGAWFEEAAARLRPGATLLLYVTDHGALNDEDTSNNRITLWGEGEDLSVSELRELIARLDSGVRVVTLMSQCFSGAFANLMYAGSGEGRPRGNVCGYFSSTAQRPAYGCYPENFDKETVGHSFRFIDALRDDPTFPGAHRQVLVADRTPDVPLKTSDVYLQGVLERAAVERGLAPNQFVDQLLLEAWNDKASWEPEIRLLDRIGQTFGLFSPRSMAELEEGSNRLPEASRQLSRYGDAWREALHALNAQNLERFLDAEPDWNRRVSNASLKQLSSQDRKASARGLLDELAVHARSDATRAQRLDVLKRNADISQAANYRMQVRLGVLLRLKGVLTNIAGRVYLANHAEDYDTDAYASLLECEALTLPASEAAPAPVSEPEPFPLYEEDLVLVESVLPGWMGIRFRQASVERREEMDLETGATAVLAVFPDSPAESAGLEAGDIILGPPNAPFSEPQQLREWVMTVPIGEPQLLLIRRGDDELYVNLTPGSYPIDLPVLPGPPEVNSVAPPLEKLKAYRGTPPTEITRSGPYLLFFWATWCAPCKAAIPELLAFERERDAPVIAITDERAAQLEPYFETRGAPFPETVAIDQSRRAFLAYGVNGTPSFVLVGADGTVKSTSTGYLREKGLDLPGWSWSSPGAVSSEPQSAR